MKILVATDIHISVCGDRYFVPNQLSSIFERYYTNFGELSVCSRIRKIEEVSPCLIDITDIIGNLIVLPSLGKAMLGLYDKTITRAVMESDLVVFRCHGIISHRVADFARKYKKRYFAEVIGCGWDAFWNHGIAGKILAPYVFFKMKQTVYNADYAVYVTKEFLQKRYPCKNESIGVSDVLIEDSGEDVLQKRLEKINNSDYKKLTLMTTAAVDVRYKGQEYVIRAIPALNKAGIRVRYLLVGGGEQTHLKGIAKKYGVEDQVEFFGRLTLTEVFELLDDVDIYIQPSLQEGLPRSVVEAMSRGCPVIGARTAGIPELISQDCIVKRKSVKDITDTIVKLADSEKLTVIANRNFRKSKDFLDDVLSEQRNMYYERILRECAENEQR